MSKIKYELKCKLDRLNEDMKSWMKQVEHGVRMWSRLPDSTLHDIYDQILTLMYRKLESVSFRKLRENQTFAVVHKLSTPDVRATEFELRKQLELEMLKSINLLENIEKEKIQRKLVEEEIREIKRQFAKSNAPPKYIVNERDSSMDKEVDQLLELDKQIAEQMDENDIPGNSDEPFTERSGGLSTDRTVSGHDTPGMPSVITELFKSLYNNEWNNCYTELTKRYTDDHTIEILRRWLKECYYTCVAITKEQRRNIRDDTLRCFYKFIQGQTSIPLSDKSKKHVRTFQRKTAKDALPLIEQLCLKRITKGQNFGDNAKEYIKRCSEICWMMNVQNPPIYLDFDLRYGYVIDKHAFSTFRTHGEYVNYVVWPAVYIHRNGPLLCKGIVESQ